MGDRLRALWQEERTAGQRAALALLASFSCMFCWVIFGVLDLYLHNAALFPFPLRTIAWPVVVTGLGATLMLAGLITLLRGKVFDAALSLTVGALLATYVQAMCMNIGMEELDGVPVPWHLYPGRAFFTLAVFMMLLHLPLILRYLHHQLWKRVVLLLPVLLTGMQTVALVASLAGADATTRDNRYLSTKGLYEMGTGNNIIVFLLDRLDARYIEAALQREPGFFNSLDGFTYFDNYLPEHVSTFPAVSVMLTGAPYDFDQPKEDYFADAWAQSTLARQLKQRRFTTKFYMARGFTYSQAAQLEGIADNLDSGQRTLRFGEGLPTLLTLSAYRYAPQAVKANLWMSPTALDDITLPDGDSVPYRDDDLAVYQGLVDEGVTLAAPQNHFLYIHLRGAHDPFVMDELGQEVAEGQTSAVQQTMGCFRILYEYMAQMKALGIYEDATILITGDHYSTLEGSLPKRVATFLKPGKQAGTPLRTSNAPASSVDVRATVLHAAGIDDASDGGIPLQVLPEDAQRLRVIHCWLKGPGAKDMVRTYQVDGDVKDMDNWQPVSEHELWFR